MNEINIPLEAIEAQFAPTAIVEGRHVSDVLLNYIHVHLSPHYGHVTLTVWHKGRETGRLTITDRDDAMLILRRLMSDEPWTMFDWRKGP
jgi:hypothetical protein